MSRCPTCELKPCGCCDHGKPPSEPCAKCLAQDKEDLIARLATIEERLNFFEAQVQSTAKSTLHLVQAAEARIEKIETLYGQRVDTFIKDTEHLLGRIEKVENHIGPLLGRIRELEKFLADPSNFKGLR